MSTNLNDNEIETRLEAGPLVSDVLENAIFGIMSSFTKTGIPFSILADAILVASAKNVANLLIHINFNKEAPNEETMQKLISGTGGVFQEILEESFKLGMEQAKKSVAIFEQEENEKQ